MKIDKIHLQYVNLFAVVVAVNLLIVREVSAQAIAPTARANDNGPNGPSGACHCHWLKYSHSCGDRS